MHWKHWRHIQHFLNSFKWFIWPTWHPSQANLGVINYFLTWSLDLITVTNEQYWVHLLVSWVSFLQVVQAKKGTSFDMQMAAHAMLHCQQHSRQWDFNCGISGFQCTSHPCSNACLYEIAVTSMEGSWALEWQCKSPGTIVLGQIMIVWGGTVPKKYYCLRIFFCSNPHQSTSNTGSPGVKCQRKCTSNFKGVQLLPLLLPIQ